MYLAAVKIVDVTELSVKDEVLRDFGLVVEKPKRNAYEVDRKPYERERNAAFFNYVVPALRERCPGLTKIVFHGTGQSRVPFEDDSWVVNCDSNPQSPTGIIEYHQYTVLSLTQKPPNRLTKPSTPDANYSTLRRHDLQLNGPGPAFCQCHHQRPIKQDQWAADLADGPLFGALYRGVDFGPLSVSLGDIAGLYKRQAASGYTERLEWLIAPGLIPWRVPELRSLAAVSGAWLTSLQLLNDHKVESDWEPPLITFRDLPEITAIIRQDLPRLTSLHIKLGKDGEAEAIAGGFLTRDSLKDGGRITDLRIFTNEYIQHPFNIVRLISGVCTSTASVYIGGLSACNNAVRDPGVVTKNYLKYLREQSTQRKFHLSTFDFATLPDVQKLADVSKLRYDAEGRPIGI